MPFSTYPYRHLWPWWSRTETPLKLWRQYCTNIKQQNMGPKCFSFPPLHSQPVARSVRACTQRLFRGLRTSTNWKIPSEWAFAWQWMCLLPYRSDAGKQVQQQNRELCFPKKKKIKLFASIAASLRWILSRLMIIISWITTSHIHFYMDVFINFPCRYVKASKLKTETHRQRWKKGWQLGTVKA